MQNLIRVIAATLCLIALLPQAQAASKGKPKTAQQVQKERLVLMPLRVGDELQSMQGAMESALVDGLQQKYTVMWGEEVEKKAQEVFRKENQKHDCNEERCMQGIAEAFQSELLATANVTKQEGGYVVILTIQNLFDHVVVFTRPLQCKGCDSFAVVDKFKELGVAAAPVAVTPATSVVAISQPKITATDPESTTWTEAQKGNTADDYQVYLDAYPKGKYVLFAKAKIKKLKEAEQAATDQQEQQIWDVAQQESSETSFNRYIQAYPSGRFAGFAKVRLDKLKNDVAAREEAELWKKAESGMDKAAVENYLSKYPAGRYLAQASAKLKAIKEEEAKGPTMIAPIALTDGSWRFEAQSSLDKHALRDVDFRRGKNGEGRVIVDLSDPNVGINIQKNGNTLIVDFVRSQLPRNLQRKLDVSDFATPVKLVDAFEHGDSARLVIESKTGYRHNAYKLENKFIVEIRN